MYATIQRWGNSQGLRIPKAMLEAIGLRENDRVELTQEEDGIRIQKLPRGTARWRSGSPHFMGSRWSRSGRWRARNWTGAARRGPRYGNGI